MSQVSSWSSPLYTTGVKRYRSPARWFHWLTALLIFAIVPLGWIFAEFKTKPNSGGHFEAPIPGTVATYASAHKTLGLLVFVLVVARLAYRFANKPPAFPGRISWLEAVVAHGTHWILYLVLLVMPVSGYIMSSGGKYPIAIFGLFDFPKLPVSQDVAKTAAGVHLSAQYAVYGLVILHVAGVCWHLFIHRDDVLSRMLPRQVNVE